MHDVRKIKGQEGTSTLGDVVADPYAIIPGESEEDRAERISQAMGEREAKIAQAAPKTPQPGEPQAEEYQPKMVSRMELGVRMRKRNIWDSPEMTGLRDRIREDIGRGGLKVFSSLARGENEGDLIEEFSNRRAYHKYKAAVVDVMREELEGRDRRSSHLLRALELMLDTARSREEPMRLSNEAGFLKGWIFSNP